MNGSLKVNPHRSSLGMDANTLSLLCYLASFILAWIPGVKYVAWAAPLVIFIIEKESLFVRFHAMQAFILQIVNWVFVVVLLGVVMNFVTYVGLTLYYGVTSAGLILATLLAIVLGLFAVVLTIFAIIALVKAGGYYEYKIPVIGNLAMKFSRTGSQTM